MKTALQTLIDWITDEVHPEQIKEQAELLLETEKKIIINAFQDGQDAGYFDSCNQYFTDNYEQ